MEYIRNINVTYIGNSVAVGFDTRPAVVYTVGRGNYAQTFEDNMGELLDQINVCYPMTADTELEVIKRVQNWIYNHSIDALPLADRFHDSYAEPAIEEEMQEDDGSSLLLDYCTSFIEWNDRWTEDINRRSAERKAARRKWYHKHFGPVARRRIKIGAFVGITLALVGLILSYWMILVVLLGVTIVLGLAMAS